MCGLKKSIFGQTKSVLIVTWKLRGVGDATVSLVILNLLLSFFHERFEKYTAFYGAEAICVSENGKGFGNIYL